MASTSEPIDITEFDKKISELFYKEAAAINFLKKFERNGINYAAALQSNIYELLVNKRANKNSSSILQNTIKVFVRNKGLDQLYRLLISLFVRPRLCSKLGEKGVAFFAENFVPHILDDFTKIIRETDDHRRIVFVSNDMRSIRYIKERLPDLNMQYIGLTDITIKQFFEVFRDVAFLHKSLRKHRTEIREVFKDLSSHPHKIKPVLWFNFLILPFYQTIFQAVLHRLRPNKIVVGSDGFSMSRVMIDVCKTKSIETYVVQHGMIQAYNGYVPLYAGNIFVWSDKEKIFFEKVGFAAKGLLVTGAPRFSGIGSKPKQSKNKINITFISSDTFLPEIEKSIETVEAISNRLTIPYMITFRPHPHVKLLTKKIYSNKGDKLKHVRFDSTRALTEILCDTDFAILSNCSTTIFEIATQNIPYRIVESPKWDNPGINLYGFKRSSVDDIVDSIYTYYKTQCAINSVDCYDRNEDTLSNGHSVHSLAAKTIGKYLLKM
jgi:hypothetical protein